MPTSFSGTTSVFPSNAASSSTARSLSPGAPAASPHVAGLHAGPSSLPSKADGGQTAAASTDDGGRPPDFPGHVYESALDMIGATPMVRLNVLPARHGVSPGVKLYAKLEYMNPGGSVKDRAALRMVCKAETAGRIRPGDTLIEPTSGNMGIGLALVGALKRYGVILTIPEKMSNEKIDTVRALGALAVRTPTAAAWDSPQSHIGVAKQLCEAIPSSHILDQYENESNWRAHHATTAPEIFRQLPTVDYVVVGAGTGGTITGIGHYVRDHELSTRVVGVDPVGSILAEPDDLNTAGIHSYVVEGVGYDFIPGVLHRDVVHEWHKVDDATSFQFARELVHLEGLLAGGSSGTALAVAIKIAQRLVAPATIVVIFPDSVRNYMSKHLNDAWMLRHHYPNAVRRISADAVRAVRTISLTNGPLESPLIDFAVAAPTIPEDAREAFFRDPPAGEIFLLPSAAADGDKWRAIRRSSLLLAAAIGNTSTAALAPFAVSNTPALDPTMTLSAALDLIARHGFVFLDLQPPMVVMLNAVQRSLQQVETALEENLASYAIGSDLMGGEPIGANAATKA